MTVTTSLLAAGITRSIGDQSNKLSAVLNNKPIASTTKSSAPVESAQVQVDAAAIEQHPPLNLRVDSLSIAYVGGQTDTLDSGATQVSRLLDQLQSLATRASLGGLSDSALVLLNGQFQALRLSISNVPPSPPGVQEVSGLLAEIPGGLDSELGQEAIAQKLTVGNFNNDKVLLGDANLKTQAAAQQAVETVAAAQQIVSAESALIGRVKEVADFAAASADTAVQNQSALRSTLSESDLGAQDVNAASLQALLQSQSDAARAVQTSKLPSNVLQLLS